MFASMNALASTTLIAVSSIICATVAVCFKVIGTGDFVALVGAFGGGTGVVHVAAAGASSSAGKSSGGSP